MFIHIQYVQIYKYFLNSKNYCDFYLYNSYLYV